MSLRTERGMSNFFQNARGGTMMAEHRIRITIGNLIAAAMQSGATERAAEFYERIRHEEGNWLIGRFSGFAASIAARLTIWPISLACSASARIWACT